MQKNPFNSDICKFDDKRFLLNGIKIAWNKNLNKNVGLQKLGSPTGIYRIYVKFDCLTIFLQIW